MYSMKEACSKVKMSYQTLKYYCNQGLIPNVKRDKNNYRIFDDNDIEWIKSLLCLKKCGMTIQEIKEYLELCLLGESSIPERKVILSKKREKLMDEINQIEESIKFIDWKQELYDNMLSGKIKYYSNLINIKK